MVVVLNREVISSCLTDVIFHLISSTDHVRNEISVARSIEQRDGLSLRLEPVLSDVHRDASRPLFIGLVQDPGEGKRLLANLDDDKNKDLFDRDLKLC